MKKARPRLAGALDGRSVRNLRSMDFSTASPTLAFASPIEACIGQPEFSTAPMALSVVVDRLALPAA